jgi:hypothetical protein
MSDGNFAGGVDHSEHDVSFHTVGDDNNSNNGSDIDIDIDIDNSNYIDNNDDDDDDDEFDEDGWIVKEPAAEFELPQVICDEDIENFGESSGSRLPVSLRLDSLSESIGSKLMLTTIQCFCRLLRPAAAPYL